MLKKEKWINNKTNALGEAFLSLKTQKEVMVFLRDLMTEPEILDFGNRWHAAKMLSQGVPYREIEEETGLSSATVARVARWLKQGKGGYSLVLKRNNSLRK